MSDDTVKTGGLRLVEHGVLDPMATTERLFVDEGVLGVGGTGEVHRVLDPRLLRRCALKRAHPGRTHPDAITRFVEEARITGQLEHPNVVPVHECGHDADGGVYVALKLVDGDTLAERIERLGEARLSSDQLATSLGWISSVCDAVAYAHSRGVVHCDIKPENVLIGRDHEVYLVDWGMALLMDDASVTPRDDGIPRPPITGSTGSPAYMSPEQASGDEAAIGHHTDVYGVGALLYTVLAGNPPYGEFPLAEAIFRAMANDHVPLSVRAPGAPQFLVEVCARAMATGPEHRYASILELQSDIASFLHGTLTAPARRVPAGTRVVTEGDRGDCAWVVQSGSLRCWTEQGGAVLELRTLRAGDVFGEMSVLLGAPRSANVEAITDVVLLEVSERTLRDGLGLNSWLGSFVTTLARRFSEADTSVRDLRASQIPMADLKRS